MISAGKRWAVTFALRDKRFRPTGEESVVEFGAPTYRDACAWAEGEARRRNANVALWPKQSKEDS